MPTYEEVMKLVNNTSPEALAANSKYKAKLTFQSRCSALAALKAGYIVAVVAEAFGINRSTLRYIEKPSSPHYKNIRKELFELGRERFIAEYLTPDVIELLAEAAKSPNVNLSGNQMRASASVDTTHPNRKATSREGRHTILYGSGTLLVEVKWYDKELPPSPYDMSYDGPRSPGWYTFVDPESPAWKDGWIEAENPFGNNDARFTSKTALDWFVAQIGGEVQE